MKVLHVIPSLSPLRGGPSFALPPLAAQQVHLGCLVDIATTDDHGPARLPRSAGAIESRNGVTIRYFPRQVRFYTVSGPLTAWLLTHVSDYDLVHIHGLFSYPPVAASLAATRRQVPYVVRPLGVLDSWGMRNRRRWLKTLSFAQVERRVLAAASLVQYTSERERSEAALLGVNRPFVICPLGLELAEFQSLPAASLFWRRHPGLAGRRVILFLSRLDRKKGVDVLIEAFARVAAGREDLALVIAGEGEAALDAELRRQAQASGLGDRIMFPGFLSGEQKLAALAAAEIFVLPSRDENFGIAAVEAMAAGLPLIVSDRVGLAPDIARASAGIVVPAEATPLAAALTGILEDPALAQQLRHNARQLAGRRYSVASAARELLDAYRLIVPERVGVIL